MKSEQDYRTQLRRIRNLPVLPEASIRVMNAVNDPEVTIDELVNALSLSPSLVARLLGLANSAYFGCPGEIKDLRKAIIQVLGLNLVKSISFSIALNVCLDTRQCKTFDARYFWVHALMTALLGKKLSERCKHELLTPTTVYTSGLLLSIGMLAAVCLYPDNMQEIFDHCQEGEKSVHQAFKEDTGISLFALGYLLLRRWHVPDIYQVVTREFDRPGYKGPEMPLIALLRVSYLIASSVVKEEPVDLSSYEQTLDRLSISHDHAFTIIEDVISRRNDIDELATIIAY